MHISVWDTLGLTFKTQQLVVVHGFIWLRPC